MLCYYVRERADGFACRWWLAPLAQFNLSSSSSSSSPSSPAAVHDMLSELLPVLRYLEVVESLHLTIPPLLSNTTAMHMRKYLGCRCNGVSVSRGNQRPVGLHACASPHRALGPGFRSVHARRGARAHVSALSCGLAARAGTFSRAPGSVHRHGRAQWQ